MGIDIATYKSLPHLEKLEAALPDAKKHYSQRNPIETYKSIGASGSMFRVFRDITKPSVIYQKWAFDTVQSGRFKHDVLSLKTQEQFENLHSELGRSLANYWKTEAKQELLLPRLHKLLDVFVKRACELKLTDSRMNDNLLVYGHVPLDSLVFNALDDIFSGILLLTGRTMGHVKNDLTYQFYQNLIRQLMRELQSSTEYPALYFEFYAWNLGREADQKQKASVTS
jgi:hypothetical protein